MWYLDGTLQKNDPKVRELVTFLISTLRIEKTTRACPYFSVSDAQTRVTQINNNLSQYAQSSKDVPKFTSRGGSRTDYADINGNTLFIHQIFYDEAFRSEIRYYLFNNKVFFITVDRHLYEKPLYIEPNPKVINVLTRDFYLGKNEELCLWYLDNAVQQNDTNTQDFINFLLSTLKKQKGS